MSTSYFHFVECSSQQRVIMFSLLTRDDNDNNFDKTDFNKRERDKRF